jgi:hypothetical protein
VNIFVSRDATQSFRVPRRDSNPGSSEPQSDALTTRPLHLNNQVIYMSCSGYAEQLSSCALAAENVWRAVTDRTVMPPTSKLVTSSSGCHRLHITEMKPLSCSVHSYDRCASSFMFL